MEDPVGVTEPTSDRLPRQPPKRAAPLVLAASALVPALLLVLGVSIPGGDPGLELLAIGLGIFLLIFWFAAVLTAPANSRTWLFLPAILVISIFVTAFGVPLRARFELSRTAFEELLSERPGDQLTVPAGLYEASEFETTDFGYRFVVSNQDSVVYGFAYSPHGPPPGPDIDNARTGEYGYRHLDGPWYTWKYIVT